MLSGSVQIQDIISKSRGSWDSEDHLVHSRFTISSQYPFLFLNDVVEIQRFIWFSPDSCIQLKASGVVEIQKIIWFSPDSGSHPNAP